MNRLLKYIFSSCLLINAVACTEGVNETVESAYQLPILPEPSYSFSRNGESSVNLLECEFLKSPVDQIFLNYMDKAYMGMQQEYQSALRLFNEGEFGGKPKEEVATSALHIPDREMILADFNSWFEISRTIRGESRSREAEMGKTGYVGINIGDKDVCFVNEKGIAVAEVYKYAIMGAVYLDKAVNKHLGKEVLENDDVLTKNDLTLLQTGHNYTELEHHWDLAYGYYGFWKSLAQASGLPALKNSYLRIFRSFVKGRTYMATSQYDAMRLEADTIRNEFSRVVAVRAINLLIGANTIANLKEDPKRAFRFLSQAYGLIYASQFACNAHGKPCITYEEVKGLITDLESGSGLWEQKRLSADCNQQGSLRNLAMRIGEKFGVSLEEIKK